MLVPELDIDPGRIAPRTIKAMPAAMDMTRHPFGGWIVSSGSESGGVTRGCQARRDGVGGRRCGAWVISGAPTGVTGRGTFQLSREPTRRKEPETANIIT
jgi:hypothetical protein